MVGLFRASSVAIAVPNDPPPNMTTLFVAARTSSSLFSRLWGVRTCDAQVRGLAQAEEQHICMPSR